MEKLAFNFSVTVSQDGIEIINPNGITDWDEIPPAMLITYKELENQLYARELEKKRMRRKARHMAIR